MNSRALISPFVLAFAATGFSQYTGSLAPPAEWRTGFNSITAADSKSILTYLAGPETMGRGTGQPGFQKAADFVADHFKRYGLKPVGDNGTFFQGVPFWRSAFVEEGSEIKLIGSGETILGGRDFRLSSLSAPLDQTTVVVELEPSGDTLNIPAADLANRIVIVRGGTPSQRFRSAVTRARPAVVLYARDVVPPVEYTVRRSAPSGDAPQRAATGYISAATAEKIASGLRWTSPASGVRVSANTMRVVGKLKAEDIKVPNVVGLFEGSDPTLKAEIIGIGSHLDHLGVSGGQVYAGADDDGSGSTALLQVAKAFAENPVKPKRSILFMAFCGEEMGLIGSAFYADNPIFPHDKMIAELQMDMVGRNSSGAQNGDQNRIDVESENTDTIRLVGSQRISTDLHKTILDVNKHVGFKFKYDAEDVYTRSDHYNFAKHGIPIAFFFTGFHPDYHQASDTIEKINFDKIANTAKLGYLTAATLAQKAERPVKDVSK